MFKRGLVVAFCLLFVVSLAGQSLSATAFAQTPQESTRAREVRATPAEVTVTLNEQFFNALLDVIFTRLKAPSFPLSIARAMPERNGLPFERWKFPAAGLTASSLTPGNCESVVILERQVGAVKTAVRFEKGRVIAPLAFRGSYSVALLGCINFQGWADTSINLEFDRQRQVLSARVTIVDIQLSNIPSIASGAIVGLVQSSIDRRINPVEILKAAQLSTQVSITGSDRKLSLRATEIRPEVVPGALSLHIYYEFAPVQ